MRAFLQNRSHLVSSGPGSDVWRIHGSRFWCVTDPQSDRPGGCEDEDLTPVFSLSCLLRSRSRLCPPLAVIGPWFWRVDTRSQTLRSSCTSRFCSRWATRSSCPDTQRPAASWGPPTVTVHRLTWGGVPAELLQETECNATLTSDDAFRRCWKYVYRQLGGDFLCFRLHTDPISWKSKWKQMFVTMSL